MAAMPSQELTVYVDNLWFARNTKKGGAMVVGMVKPAVVVPESQEGELAAVKQLLVKDPPSKVMGAWRGKEGHGSRGGPGGGHRARVGPGTTCATAMQSLGRRLTTETSCKAVPGQETRSQVLAEAATPDGQPGRLVQLVDEATKQRFLVSFFLKLFRNHFLQRKC